MSASHEWWEYHLTPGGWVAGTAHLDHGKAIETPIPPDRVLTIIYHERVSSVFSRMKRSVEVEWQSDDAEQVSRLKEQHGDLPEHVEDQIQR